jgi:hypothetical protein
MNIHLIFIFKYYTYLCNFHFAWLDNTVTMIGAPIKLRKAPPDLGPQEVTSILETDSPR